MLTVFNAARTVQSDFFSILLMVEYEIGSLFGSLSLKKHVYVLVLSPQAKDLLEGSYDFCS